MTEAINLKQARTIVAAVSLSAIMLLSSFGVAQAAKPSNGSTIVGTAIAVNAESGEFDTLISAVVNLGLVDALSGNRPYTVFAPTDAAFADIGITANTFVGLSDEDRAFFTNVVLYHVTNGKRAASSVVGNKSLKMINGDRALVSGTTIDGANIIATDVRTSNGIIHIVDTVLLP